jgi:hypothetical protein
MEGNTDKKVNDWKEHSKFKKDRMHDWMELNQRETAGKKAKMLDGRSKWISITCTLYSVHCTVVGLKEPQ